MQAFRTRSGGWRTGGEDLHRADGRGSRELPKEMPSVSKDRCWIETAGRLGSRLRFNGAFRVPTMSWRTSMRRGN